MVNQQPMVKLGEILIFSSSSLIFPNQIPMKKYGKSSCRKKSPGSTQRPHTGAMAAR